MRESELVKIIRSHIDDGIGSDFGEISNARQELFDRYMGELYGNERDGQSKVTTREVFETVEWAMPAIMRVFMSGDRVVEFEPEGPEDEDAAEQETDAVNYQFLKDNNGYATLYTLFKSCLMMPNSYVKVVRDEKEEVTKDQYTDVTDEELSYINVDDELEILSASVNEYGLYDLEVQRTQKRGKNRVVPLPEEQVQVDGTWSELDLDECPFASHSPEKTHSELLQLGYDEDDLNTVYSNEDYNSEEYNRRHYSDETYTDDETHKALRKYTVHECWMLVDWDDDGIAERRRVVMIGNKIFENDETDEMAIASAASILMPHKHTGLSLAQTIIDIQEIKTTVMRQLLNNMYRMNNPRTIVGKTANISDVLANRANGVLRATNPADINIEPTAPVIAQVVPLLELLDMQKEGRTGITRNGMGLDADILAKATEGAFMGALEKADQRIEMLVRTLAETVVKKIFLKLHALMLKHGDTKFMRTNGQWIEVDPTQWSKRENMTVRVGLGLGDRKQKMFAAKLITEDHDKLLGMGMGGTLVSPENLYHGRRLMVEATGEQSIDKYYLNPSLIPPKPPEPPQPDPNLLLIQSNERIEKGKQQLKAMEMQFKSAEDQRKARFNERQLATKNQIEVLKAQISASKNEDDSANKELMLEIKGLETRLNDAQHEESLAMEQYRADLNAQTQILLKEMEQDREAQTALVNINSVIEKMNQ